VAREERSDSERYSRPETEASGPRTADKLEETSAAEGAPGIAADGSSCTASLPESRPKSEKTMTTKARARTSRSSGARTDLRA